MNLYKIVGLNISKANSHSYKTNNANSIKILHDERTLNGFIYVNTDLFIRKTY